jgi:hypothetical protein
MKQYPYEDLSKKKAQKLIMQGKPPPLSDRYNDTNIQNDPYTKTLIQAMHMCWKLNPEERATARQVEQFIDGELAKLGVQGNPV